MCARFASERPAFRKEIFAHNLMLLFLNFSSITVWGMMGGTLDRIILWEGTIRGLIVKLLLLISIVLCLAISFSTVSLESK